MNKKIEITPEEAAKILLETGKLGDEFVCTEKLVLWGGFFETIAVSCDLPNGIEICRDVKIKGNLIMGDFFLSCLGLQKMEGMIIIKGDIENDIILNGKLPRNIHIESNIGGNLTIHPTRETAVIVINSKIGGDVTLRIHAVCKKLQGIIGGNLDMRAKECSLDIKLKGTMKTF